LRTQPGDAKANVPTVYGVKMSKMGSAADLKAGLAKLVGHGSRASSMLVCEVWSNKLFKVFPHDASVSRIQPRDEIWVYECPVLAENEAEERAAREAKEGKDIKHENWISIQVTNSATNKKQKKSSARLIGTPFVVAVPESKIRAMNVQELRDIVFKGVTPFLRGACCAHHCLATDLPDDSTCLACLQAARPRTRRTAICTRST
jgi:hypothetical protein